MKSCPTCNRTFEDSFTFCLIDGSVLSAPLDLHATLVIPQPRLTEPPPTEVLAVAETREAIPPTIASPESEPKPEKSVSTIVAPASVFELPNVKASSAQLTRPSSRSPLIMAGVGALIVIGLVYFIAINQTGSTSENSNRANVAMANTALPTATSSNSNQTSNMAATPSPSPSSVTVINLEGTEWKGKTFDGDSESDEHFRFKQNGKMQAIYPDFNNIANGTWAIQGDKVLINVERKTLDITGSPAIFNYKIEGTILGDEMRGDFIFPYFDNKRNRFVVHRVNKTMKNVRPNKSLP